MIGRLRAAGALEVAGPVAAEDVGAVAEELIALGAERVLIDGALDRRASAAPAVADGVVVATGAVLSPDMDEVVRRTKDAADSAAVVPGPRTPSSGESSSPHKLALEGPAEDVATLLREHPEARCTIVKGALCEPFLEGVVRARRGETFRIVVDDARCVFLTRRSVGWYAAHGVTIEAVAPIRLAAITVNPVAPLAHSFDAAAFRERVGAAVPDVPVFDVLHTSYAAR